MELYHYTNRTGFDGIMDSRQIWESVSLDDGDDARFGKGVYLTSLPPSAGKKAIIADCWGPNWDANRIAAFLNTGRVDFFIRVILTPNRVHRATKKRNVYIHKGILYLDQNPTGGKF